MIAALPAVPAIHSVVEVDRHLLEWDRQVILVRGWINICGPGRAVGPAITQTKRCRGRRYLPISISPAVFPGGASKLVGRQVVLRARVDATCRRQLCFDRYSLLHVERVKFLSSSSDSRSY